MLSACPGLPGTRSEAWRRLHPHRRICIFSTVGAGPQEHWWKLKCITHMLWKQTQVRRSTDTCLWQLDCRPTCKQVRVHPNGSKWVIQSPIQALPTPQEPATKIENIETEHIPPLHKVQQLGSMDYRLLALHHVVVGAFAHHHLAPMKSLTPCPNRSYHPING